jgi:hypothetical protein
LQSTSARASRKKRDSERSKNETNFGEKTNPNTNDKLLMTTFSQPERRGLERMQVPKPDSHPDADLLTAFAEQSLTSREHEQVLGHVAACAECRDVVALAGSALVEPIPEPVRKRGMWEIPLFRWGAVAATTVVVIGAVSLGIYDRERTPEALYTREAPLPAAQPSNVSVLPPSNDSRRDMPVPGVSAKRAVHLQEQVRFEKPASAPTNAKEKDSKLNGAKTEIAGLLGGPLSTSREGAARSDAGHKYQSKVATASAPPVSADLDKAFQTSANAPLAARDSTSLSLRTAPAVGEHQPEQAPQLEQKTASKQPSAASASQSVEISAAAANVYPADEAKVTAQNEIVQMDAASVPQAAPPAQSEQSLAMSKSQAERAKAGLFHEVRPIESVVTGTEWQITREGELQRSFSRGNFWEPMLKRRQFRSVAVVRDHIWAGGDDGALYFSSDNGRTWNPMSIHDANASVTGNVINLRFADAQNGSLGTSTGESWNTNDGGQSWHKQ